MRSSGVQPADGVCRVLRADRPRLVRLCFLTTLDREAAADAAQEALSRAWRDWSRVGADSSDPTAWTTTVALNLCRNRWQRLASQARLAPRAYRVDGKRTIGPGRQD